MSATERTTSGVAADQDIEAKQQLLQQFENELLSAKVKVLQFREKNKRIIGCWRVAPMYSESDKSARISLRLLAAALSEDGNHSILNKFFVVTVTKKSIELIYEIEYISLLPDSSFVLTLSVFSWKDRDSLHENNSHGRLAHLNKNCVNLHKLIPQRVLVSELRKILVKKCQDLKIILPKISIENAVNHYSEFLSPSKADYCEWNRCCSDVFFCQTTYPLFYISPDGSLVIRSSNVKELGDILEVGEIQWTQQDGAVKKFTNVELRIQNYHSRLPVKDNGGESTFVNFGRSEYFKDSQVVVLGEANISTLDFSPCLVTLVDGDNKANRTVSRATKVKLRNIKSDKVQISDVDFFSRVKKASAIHIIKPFDQNGRFVLNEKLTEEPLIVVAWNSYDNDQTHAVIVYRLFSRQMVGRMDFPLDDEKSADKSAKDIGASYSKWKISCITSILPQRESKTENLNVNSSSKKKASELRDDENYGDSITLVLGVEFHDVSGIRSSVKLLPLSLIKDGNFTWDAMIKAKHETAEIHTNTLSCLEVQGNFIYVGSFDNTFSIIPFNVDDQKDITLKPPSFPMENTITKAPTHNDIILAVAPIDAKGTELFTSSWDTTIRYWKQVELEKINLWSSVQFPIEHVKKVGCLAYAEFPNWISKLQNVQVSHWWNKTVYEVFNGLRGCSSPDQPKSNVVKILVSGGLDGVAIVWDVANPAEPKAALRLMGHTDEITDVKVHRHHDSVPVVVTCAKDKTIRFWDILTGNCYRKLSHKMPIFDMDLIRVCSASNDSDGNIEFKVDGDLIVSSSDVSVMVWNFLSNHRQSIQFSDPVISLAVFPFQIDSEELDQRWNEGLGSMKSPTCKALPTVDEVNKKFMYKPEHSQHEVLLIGTNASTVITSINSTQVGEVVLGRHEKKKARVNAIAVISIDASLDDCGPGIYFVAGMGDGVISIAECITNQNSKSFEFVELCYFSSGLVNVFSLACFDPSKVLKPENNSQKSEGKTPAATPSSQPAMELLLYAGGMAGSEQSNLQIWSFTKLLSAIYKVNNSKANNVSNEIKFEKLSGAQRVDIDIKKATVRCLKIHYGTYERTMLVTGDYNKTCTVWSVKHSCKLFELSGLHSTQFILDVEIFDPLQAWIRAKGDKAKFSVKWQMDPPSNKNEKENDIDLRDHFIVCTGGYDGKIGLWPIRKDLIDDKPWESAKTINTYRSMEHDKLQSVTAMSIFYPTSGSDVYPLLFTGSIDNLIYVWDIYSQELLRVLTGHSNRINALKTYFLDESTPVLVSGSDDCSTVIWNDGPQHHTYPPSKHSIIRTFYSDIIAPGRWDQMKTLRKMHPDLFMEMPHLFYLALIERQESFFVEFIDDLKRVITRIPGYSRSKTGHCHWVHHVPSGKVDILEYAMHMNSLVALRAILLAWSHALSSDITDSVNQNTLHTIRTFNEKNLLELATNFPVEYTDFMKSLRLVTAHSSVGSVDHKLNRVIPHGKRAVVIGSNEFIHGPLNERFRSREVVLQRVFDFLIACKLSILRDQDVHAQAVLPFMLPIKRFVDLRQFHCAVKTSDYLNNVDIFDSEVMITAITHYWNVFGWRLYLVNFLQYAFTVFLFVVSIYAYQQVLIMPTFSRHKVRQAQLAVGFFVFFMIWFGVDEISQLIGKFFKLHKHQWSVARGLHLIVNHLLFDFWNIIDTTVVVTGILGSASRLITLSDCYKGQVCDRFTEGNAFSSCLLAATAVMLWFKVLYFLRPIKAAGQFVAMVMIIMNDIKYFLFVLMCVLTGFAQGFWLLMNDAQPESDFTDVRESYFTTFMFMFGDIDVEALSNSKSKAFTKIFLVAFMLTMMILLFNLLIALMGDSFSRVKEKIEANYWKELTSFMVDQSIPTPLLLILHYFGYFGLLRYEKDDIIHVVKYASDVKDVTTQPTDDALSVAFNSCESILRSNAEQYNPKDNNRSWEGDIISNDGLRSGCVVSEIFKKLNDVDNHDKNNPNPQYVTNKTANGDNNPDSKSSISQRVFPRSIPGTPEMTSKNKLQINTSISSISISSQNSPDTGQLRNNLQRSYSANMTQITIYLKPTAVANKDNVQTPNEDNDSPVKIDNTILSIGEDNPPDSVDIVYDHGTTILPQGNHFTRDDNKEDC